MVGGKVSVTSRTVSVPLLPALGISKSERVAAPQPFTHRLFPPFCLPQASESPGRAGAGPAVLAVTVAVPLCVLALVAVLALRGWRRRRGGGRRAKQLSVEEPLSECNLVSSGKTLRELIHDMTTSGSGSGRWGLPCGESSWCLYQRQTCHLACRALQNVPAGQGVQWGSCLRGSYTGDKFFAKGGSGPIQLATHHSGNRALFALFLSNDKSSTLW